ncbi:Sporulation stage III protein AF [Syntrophobotulus glycolicus DSM 8271]|uniref:Sporulation stage III protein AF n=1 Tax=Syntrophobotulus glycolicus (strain DSM 8271 / FlGlyR) TaxID=645991 RepID=F0T0R9_SYNGF|nr:stage III sporulation protein AF [Syntrophobotulus glycolicus]ADY56208.1 Sporulation stage III protein AF [Syntrophobotulus glycolicus DSM 8271]
MEGLKLLIKNLTFILLLASVLELLLPNKSMRGFVQLIMGLFVISAVLTPMTDLIKVKLPNQIPAFADQSASDLPVLAAGGEDKNVGESAVNEQYKKILVGQVKTLAEENEVFINKVEIELEKDYDRTSYPKVEKIIIALENPSNVNVDDLRATGSDFKEKVALFLQVPENIIEIM